MWNLLVAGLLSGATIVLLRRQPAPPRDPTVRRWRPAIGATVLGTSPGYLRACAKAGAQPGPHDLGALRAVALTGSPLPPAPPTGSATTSASTSGRVSTSGGTDVVSASSAAAPSCPSGPANSSALPGCRMDAWTKTAGRSRRGRRTGHHPPLPSMPVASGTTPTAALPRELLRRLPRRLAPRRLDRRSPRRRRRHPRPSDSTLNRHGVRIGSADIYDASSACPRSPRAWSSARAARRRLLDAALRDLDRRRGLDDELRAPRSSTRSAPRSHRATSPTRSSSRPASRTRRPARSSRSRSSGCSRAPTRPPRSTATRWPTPRPSTPSSSWRPTASPGARRTVEGGGQGSASTSFRLVCSSKFVKVPSRST